jgi:hypothetical protein
MSSLPYVIQESQINAFNFYHQGQRRPAILFRDHLYVQAQTFNSDDRLNAYSRSYELNEIGDVILTVSKAGYRLWTNLQTAVA